MSLSSEIVADSPIGYWPLSETSGTVASPTVGSFNGTYVSPYTLNQPSLIFDGTPSVRFSPSKGRVTFGFTNIINALVGASAYTFEMMLKINSWDATNGRSILQAYRGDPASPGGTNQWALCHVVATGSSGDLSITTGGNGSSNLTWGPTGVLSLGTIYHFVIRVTGYSVNPRVIDLFLNGAKWGSTSSSLTTGTISVSSTPPVSPYPSGIPGDGDSTGSRHDMWASDFAIYGFGLSDSRILAHYNATQTLATHPPVYAPRRALRSYQQPIRYLGV